MTVVERTVSFEMFGMQFYLKQVRALVVDFICHILLV